eukprot:Seg1746.5 transcript_id=Seg1746.5/GoldUCD/mRNA.D3Y31 product="Major facilitator superfamily domain-containing protein 8" protein_id=Seg1746.5/GoldUCD/D3Y31
MEEEALINDDVWCDNDDEHVDGDQLVDGGSENETTQRWKSIRVLYLTVFFNSIEFAIFMSSLWPYLKKVDANVSATFLGWTNSGFSLCAMIGSGILGVWCHYCPAAQPLHFAIFVRFIGSLLYGYAEAFGTHGIYAILVARLLLGFSGGNAAVCRTVLSQSTTLTERTNAFANLAIAQGIGFTVGPGIQAAMVPLGNKGFSFAPMKLTLNVYTAAGFVGVLMALINFGAIVIWFREIKVDIYAGQKKIEVDADDLPRPDLRAIGVASILYFVFQLVFSLNETIITPLGMDEFAWTKTKAVLYSGVILIVAGVLAIACFIAVKYASKKFGERAVLTFGLVASLAGFVVYLPWGNEYPVLQTSKIISNGNQTTTELTPGCPMKYDWCKTTPKIYFSQFLVGAAFVTIGYPVGFVVINTIYSKLLGPRKQGAYMAWIVAIGSLAKVVGPLLVTNAYVDVGPRWTFFIVDVLITLTIVLLGCNYGRLVPFHDYIEKKQ